MSGPIRLPRLLLVAALALLGAARPAGAETWEFTTLEWPPFSGNSAEGGAVGAVLSAAFGSQGDHVIWRVLPWKRAMAAGIGGAQGVGFFPASPAECESAGGRLFARAVGHYQFTLAQRDIAPINWEEPADLAGLRIGVVDGYDNGALLNQLQAEGKITLAPSQNDLNNLRKLQAGRVDAAVVEISQFALLGSELNQKGRAAGLSSISLNPKPLMKLSHLHVCFNHTPAADRAIAALTAGMAAIDAYGVQTEYMNRYVPSGVATN